MLELGRRYWCGDGLARNPAAGEALFKQAVELGDTDAMEVLGDRYANGRGVGVDWSKAAVCFWRAADARYWRDATGSLHDLAAALP
jgi:TPR repeat protein